MRDINSNSRVNAMAYNRRNLLHWPITGATHCHAQLGLLYKRRAFKELVDFNSWDVSAFKPTKRSRPAPRCYHLSSAVVVIVIISAQTPYIRVCDSSLYCYITNGM